MMMGLCNHPKSLSPNDLPLHEHDLVHIDVCGQEYVERCVCVRCGVVMVRDTWDVGFRAIPGAKSMRNPAAAP
ncbi:MAG TPA: hypothetical protein PKN47_01705 [Nitrospira sp.]|nr:hypothetical protein [Nitrospira sp.]